MVSCANIHPTRQVCETAERHDLMVSVERGNLPRTLVHPAKEKMWGRMGPYTHNCQELCIISIPSASARTTIRKTNGWIFAFVGPDSTKQEPALQRTDTRGDWVSTTVRGGRRVRDTTREYRIAISLQETIVEHYALHMSGSNRTQGNADH